MRVSLNDVPKLLASHPELKLGCVVDTNTLFAAAMPLDRLNEWAERVFDRLEEHSVPVFTNINIRSEFLDLQRRVLIPEGLVTYYAQTNKEAMDETLKAQLKSLKTAKDEAGAADKLFKFNEQQIKKYRGLLRAQKGPHGRDAWDHFCEIYLRPYLAVVWDATISLLKMQFVGTRGIESREYFNSDPNWKDMTDIIGRFGIGSSDAMIVNFFLCSKFPMIVTGDEDVADAVERMSGGSKYVLVNKGKEPTALR